MALQITLQMKSSCRRQEGLHRKTISHDEFARITVLRRMGPARLPMLERAVLPTTLVIRFSALKMSPSFSKLVLLLP